VALKERFPTYNFVLILLDNLDPCLHPRLFPTIGFQIITEHKLN
jgi:hypothetical protein